MTDNGKFLCHDNGFVLKTVADAYNIIKYIKYSIKQTETITYLIKKRTT